MKLSFKDRPLAKCNLATMGKFITRFHALERELEKQGRKLGEADLAGLDEIWNRVKTSSR